MSEYDKYDYAVETKLKWHKFLIYFSLWAGALVNVANAAQCFTGMMYGDSGDAARVYAFYNGLKGLDMALGFAYLFCAVYSIYVRFQLARFKFGAPGKLTVLYILQTGIQLVYVFAASGIVNMPVSALMNRNMVGTIIGCIVIVIINRVYYGKRSHLFVN